MSPWVRPYCLFAGGMDALTGLLLVAAPLGTLGLMGIVTVPAEPIYLRFVGVFVGAVGLAYLYPFLLTAARRAVAWRSSLEITALVRSCVGIFVAGAVGGGALEPRWSLVGATDLALALAQIWMLRRGSFDG